AYTNTVSMPVSKKAHQAQFPAMPFFRTMSVTRFGVSAENVVATIETPSSHQGMLRPDRKKSAALRPALREVHSPIAIDSTKTAATIDQSRKPKTMYIASVWIQVFGIPNSIGKQRDNQNTSMQT